MDNNWKASEDVIRNFKIKNSNRVVTTLDEEDIYIDPQMIIGINSNYEYDEILNDYKMNKLRESVNIDGWLDRNVSNFSLLMFPDGYLVVNGGGNHRAVLSKELKIPLVKASVKKIIYLD